MKRFSDRFIQASIAAWTIVGATACRPLDADTAQVQAKRIEQLPEGSAAVVHLDQGRLAAIRVELVGLESAPGNVRATGKVQLDENLVARIVAPLSGRVTNLDVKLGDQVRRGQPLFLLDSRDAAEALETHAASHRDLDLAEKTLTMTQDLFDHQAASRIALEQARTDVEKARTRVERTERALEAIGVRPDEESDRLNPSVPVTSPIDGVVIDRHLSNGQYVQPDSTPLITVANLSTVWVEADVFERDLHALQLGQEAEVSTTAYPDADFTARVVQVGDVLDATTRTTKVRFSVLNPGHYLKPEMFASVTLVTSDAARAITVPAAAVLVDGDHTFAYVQIDPQTFVRRQINVVADTPTTRRVTSGLAETDRVVTDGVLLLRQQEDHGSN